MRTGDTLATGYINESATYSKVTATAAYAVDESGRNIGVLIAVESLMLTAVVITAADGSELYRSPVRRRKHSVLDIIPCKAGVTIAVSFLATSGTIDLSYYPKKMAGGTYTAYLSYWPWRYYWGDFCPVPFRGSDGGVPWAYVRLTGGAVLELPKSLPKIRWENTNGTKMALLVYPDASPADEWNAEKDKVRKTYYTPPLLPDEVDALRSLAMAATGITIDDGYAPARLEAMTIAAEFGDGQQLIKLTFAYEVR